MGEGKGASCGDTDQIWCSVGRCGAQKGQKKTQALVRATERKVSLGKIQRKKIVKGFVSCNVPLRQ